MAMDLLLDFQLALFSIIFPTTAFTWDPPSQDKDFLSRFPCSRFLLFPKSLPLSTRAVNFIEVIGVIYEDVLSQLFFFDTTSEDSFENYNFFPWSRLFSSSHDFYPLRPLLTESLVTFENSDPLLLEVLSASLLSPGIFLLTHHFRFCLLDNLPVPFTSPCCIRCYLPRGGF